MNFSGDDALECEVDCREPYSEGIERFIATLTTLDILVLLAVLYWILENKKFLAHYFEYCFIFTFGAVILTSSILAWPLNNSQQTCNLKPGLLALGFGLMFGIFAARIRKVWKNFVWLRRQSLGKVRKSINSRKMSYEPQLIVFLILGVEFSFIVIFFVVPEFRPECSCRPYLEEDNEYARCSFNSIFGATLLFTNLIPLFFVVFYSYEILAEFRKAREETYNESQGIILGVSQDEVDEFQPIFASVFAICFFGLLVMGFSVMYEALQENSTKRKSYYVGRSILLMCATTIPVYILISRAHALTTTKKTEQLLDGTDGYTAAASGFVSPNSTRITSPLSRITSFMLNSNTSSAKNISFFGGNSKCGSPARERSTFGQQLAQT
eukprot:snap_masked-scaffold_1-processed-gene-19.57-mRNA-1 protein AED:1.00 eAED:1.00 QI:0/-1/0/0/-1/1/1/0/381